MIQPILSNSQQTQLEQSNTDPASPTHNMRPSQFAVLASLALTRPVSAGFYIYAINILNNIGEINFDGYTFYTGPPACSDGGIVTLPALDDVSGSKGGVRCEGCSSAYAEKEPEPTELEWNNGDGSHYSK